MTNIQVYNSLDEALMDSAKNTNPLHYIDPVNGNEKEQKEEFLAGKTQNPKFQYKDLEYDPNEIRNMLNSIEIPDDALGQMFQQKRRNTLLENRIIENLGNEDIVREASSTIYGIPNEQLVGYADSLLRQTPNIEFEKNVPSDMIKKALEEALANNDITDWQVEFSDKKLTTAYPEEKRITVCKDRGFPDIDLTRAGIHEVDVHALRATNGYEQPLKIFAIGLPGYLPTEEGLTSYFEEVIGNTNKEVMRNYAGRVIAVDSVCKGLDFSETFDRLKNYELTDDQAWDLSVRAHRAGGYIKDHVYLEGLVKVRDFAETDGDFRTLYVGKVGIDNLPLVRELLKEGTLKEAKYVPKFVE